MESIHIYIDDIVSTSYQGISQKVLLQPCGVFDKLAFEREDQSHGVTIKGYYSENGLFDRIHKSIKNNVF